MCWAGPLEEGEEVVRPLRALGTPLVDLLGPIPYVALQQLVDPLYAAGAANYFTSAFLDELPDPAVETFADAHRRSAGLPATCELHVHQLGGAMARTAPGATAFSQRQPPYLINCIARTPTAEGFEANRAWARGTRDSMARFGAGQMYVNFTGEGDEDKARASYPAESHVVRVVENLGRYISDFYITFTSEDQAVAELAPGYPTRMAGTVALADGTTIGHALHQFRETTDGFDALLAIYFPAATPEEFIEGHRQHLAVEFTNWITGAGESLGRTSNSPVPPVVTGTEPYRS